MLKVVIDPGHYKNYNAGVTEGYYEGNMVYALAMQLKAELERDNQIEVILTKNSMEENPGVFERGKIAVKSGATIFLSLHSNAVGDIAKYEKAYGVSVYRSLFLPDSEDLGNKLADAITEVMAQVTGVTYSRGVLTRKAESTGRDYYGVIRGAVNNAGNTAAAAAGSVKHAFIIEHGFHTNSRECQFLNTDANIALLARVEADVIKKHYGITCIDEREVIREGTNSGQDDQEDSITDGSVIGTVKVIYEGSDGLDVHKTPEWGISNLNTINGPVFAKGTYRVTAKIKVGSGYMYKLHSGAGYITANENYVTFTPSQSMPLTEWEIKAGDKVKVIRNVTYTGRNFKTYYDKYDVLSVNGDRAVIGIGKTVTAAINVKDIVRA